MFPSCHESPAVVNDASPKATVGGYYYFSGDAGATAPTGLYRYMQAEDADWADGECLEFANTTGTEATNDRSGGASIGKACAGCAVGAVTDAYYGYILVKGIHNALLTDGTVDAGSFLVCHTNDSVATLMADGEEEQVFGMALESDDSSNIVSAAINCY